MEKFKLDIKTTKNLIAVSGRTNSDISLAMGMSRSFISDIFSPSGSYYNIKGYADVKPIYVKMLAFELGCDVDALKFKDEVITTKEEVNTEEVNTNVVVDNSDVVSKLDELLMAVNKLGNIQMQNMELLQTIKKVLGD